MSKFTTLNLKTHFNAGRDPDGWHPEIGGELSALPAGRQTFWGIPFDLGPAGGNCWLVLEHNGTGVTIPLSGTASYLVMTHSCDESHDPEGCTQPADYQAGEVTRPGEHLADYVLVYADGSEYRQPIRRRFEVGEAMVAWGQRAFAARPHTEDEPRDLRGPYPAAQWGFYQTSVGQSPDPGPLRYWLYALENPHPDKELAAIRLATTGADRLAVAGITLYHGREHPLRHHCLESLQVALPDPALPDDVETDVDLGIIARRYAVPAFDPVRWLEEQPKGWGEETAPPQPTTQLLLDVTASPDATLQVDEREVDLRPVYEDGQGQSADGQVRIRGVFEAARATLSQRLAEHGHH